MRPCSSMLKATGFASHGSAAATSILNPAGNSNFLAASSASATSAREMGPHKRQLNKTSQRIDEIFPTWMASLIHLSAHGEKLNIFRNFSIPSVVKQTDPKKEFVKVGATKHTRGVPLEEYR